MLAAASQLVERFLWRPSVDAAPLPLRMLVRALRFAYATARDAVDGQLNLRAMSLVYTTLLSVVPLIAFSFSVLKGLGVHNNAQPWLYNFLQPLGPRGEELTREIIGFVDNVNLKALGAVGLGFLIFTVVSLVQKVEESFNYVWQVDQGRSLARRFSEYLSVILIGPLLMLPAVGLIATVKNSDFVLRLQSIEPFGTTLVTLGELGPFILVVALFSFVYGFIPNTRVHFRTALAGGITAGVTWAATSGLFASFVASSTKYTAIYSGFAVVLLALIWVYVNWLILLLGANVSFYFQNPLMLRRGRKVPVMTNRVRERLALLVMYLVGEDFQNASPRWTAAGLARRLLVPSNALRPTLRMLERRDLLVETDDLRLLPGRDLAAIPLKEILTAVRTEGNEADEVQKGVAAPVDKIVEDIEAAMADSLSNKTLQDLLEQRPSVEPVPLVARGD